MKVTGSAVFCSVALFALLAASCLDDDALRPLLTEDSGAPEDAGADIWLETAPREPPPRPPPKERPPPYTCVQPLPADFACKAPASKPGKSVCTDAMLDEFLNCFGSDGSYTKCAAAIKAYPDCQTCVLKDWLWKNSIDTAACIATVAPKDPCATVVRCNTDCLGTVCPVDDCDSTPGSGSTATRSQLDECWGDAQFAGSTLKAKGACYEVASKGYAECAARSDLAVCIVTTKPEVLRFLRGACRDGGDWTKSTTGTTDAGEEAGAFDAPPDTADATPDAFDAASE